MTSGARVRTIITLITAVMIVVVGCSGEADGSGSGGGDHDGSPPEPAQPAEPVAPLTGEAVESVDDLDHPAVAIKISNVEEAHPHVGIDRADIVFTEVLGDSYTRLAAVFHSDLPKRVGPVRSVRPPDAPLLGPLKPVFGNTMGADWVVDYVDSSANVDDLGTLNVPSGSGGYSRASERPEPDHVFAHPNGLLELSDFTEPPEPYFDYAGKGQQTSADRAGRKGSRLKVQYGLDWQIAWKYDADEGRYLRSEPWGEHVTEDGVRVGAVNVLVIAVAAPYGKLGKGNDAKVPIPELVDGSGSFTVLTGGKSAKGEWSKAGENEPFEFRTDDGKPLRLAPGSTWVEMPDVDAEISPR